VDPVDLKSGRVWTPGPGGNRLFCARVDMDDWLIFAYSVFFSAADVGRWLLMWLR